MKLTPGLLGLPVLTRKRIWFALAVAVIVDGLQLGLGPLGWAFADELLDVVAMVLISWAIGFHMLLLPTFVLELFPVVDWLPTWIGCTSAVVMLRRTGSRPPPPPPPPTAPGSPPIDISSEVIPDKPPKLPKQPGQGA